MGYVLGSVKASTTGRASELIASDSFSTNDNVVRTSTLVVTFILRSHDLILNHPCILRFVCLKAEVLVFSLGDCWPVGSLPTQVVEQSATSAWRHVP
jgi:hypothetical protein